MHCPIKLGFSLTYSNQYNAIQYNTKLTNTIQYNAIQYNTIQYNTIGVAYTTIQYQNPKKLVQLHWPFSLQNLKKLK